MAPFGHDDAVAFFRKVIASVEVGGIALIAARLDGRIVGTVQLGLDTPPNQPHRADVMKMLVHRAARKRGIGAALMERAEAEARARGRTLLVLDTASGDAERLYATRRLAARRGHSGLRALAGRRVLRHNGFLEEAGRVFRSKGSSPLIPAQAGNPGPFTRSSHFVAPGPRLHGDERVIGKTGTRLAAKPRPVRPPIRASRACASAPSDSR